MFNNPINTECAVFSCFVQNFPPCNIGKARVVEHSCEWKHQVNLSKSSGVAVREVVREGTEILNFREVLRIMDKLSTWSPKGPGNISKFKLITLQWWWGCRFHLPWLPGNPWWWLFCALGFRLGMFDCIVLRWRPRHNDWNHYRKESLNQATSVLIVSSCPAVFNLT